MSDENTHKSSVRRDVIINYIKQNGMIMNTDARKLFNVSSVTANRILDELAKQGVMTKCRKGGHWAYTQ